MKDGEFKKLKRELYPVPDLANKIKLEIEDTFGVISDTHIGASGEALTELESAYDNFAERGIHQVFHSGDLTDGENVYAGHMRYVKVHGFTPQVNYVIKKFPLKAGIKTYVIAGNHDTSFLIRSGADIVEEICNQREDMQYAGLFYVRLQDEKLKLDLLHPRGGAFYSKSYGIQKWIRNNEMPSTYPDVMIFGHWHQHAYFNDHGIECIMAGNFQHPNEYHIRMGFVGSIGGFIVEIPNKDSRGIKLEWISKERKRAIR